MARALIIEVKTLCRGIDVQEGLRSGKVFTHDESKRIKDDILSELEKYVGKGIRYPLAVIVARALWVWGWGLKFNLTNQPLT